MKNDEFIQSKRKQLKRPRVHKFNKKLTLTYEEAFEWRFEYYIEIMQRLAEYIGREKLIEMIRRAVDNRSKVCEQDNPDHTLTKYIELGKKLFKNMMAWEIIEESDTVYEMKVTECLWAKTFQERDAADIGYATICYGDFSDARAYHSKLKLELTKTLMQGDNCCNHRWTWERDPAPNNACIRRSNGRG